MYSKAIKLALSILLLSNQAFAQQRVEKIDVLEGQKTYKNYVKNPSAIKNTNGTSVSSATIARDTDAADKLDGIASFNCDASAQNGYCLWQVSTINEGDKTGNCEVSATFKGDASLYSLRLTDGTNTLYDLPLKNQTDWGGASFNYPCGATRDVRLVQTTAGTAPAVNIGRIYYGPATNLVNASVVSDWIAYTPIVTNYTGGITNYTVYGSYKRLGDSVIIQGRISFSSSPAVFNGVLISLPSGLTRDSAKTGSYTSLGSFIAWDASNNSYPGDMFSDTLSTVSLVPTGIYTHSGTAPVLHPGLLNNFPFSFGSGDSITWISDPIPILGWTSSSMAVIPSLPSSPTIQRFTSGSGTYTTPQGVKYIKVKMVGGGGGGGGGGNGTGLSSTGSAGGNTSFGDWVAGGGSGGGGAGTTVGVVPGGAPTSNTVGTGTLILNSIGGYGLTGSWNMGISAVGAVGTGGASCVSGPVSTGYNSNSATAGISATGNTGNGGSGGGRSETGYGIGSGGAGGSCLEFTMSSTQVGASKSFTVGIGGAGGAASSGTGSGGAGGSGVIIVEEYYHTENAPILVDENEMSVLYRHDSGQALTSLGVIKFNVKVKDDFDSYNPTTGVFTAPFAGTYEISYTLFSASATTSWEPYIRKNGTTINRTRAIPTYSGGTSIINNQSTAISSPYIVYLTKGETLDVYLGYAASAGTLYTNALDSWLTIKRVGN